jgi:hypothetical protein
VAAVFAVVASALPGDMSDDASAPTAAVARAVGGFVDAAWKASRAAIGALSSSVGSAVADSLDAFGDTVSAVPEALGQVVSRADRMAESARPPQPGNRPGRRGPKVAAATATAAAAVAAVPTPGTAGPDDTVDLSPGTVATMAGNGTVATVDGVGANASFKDMGGTVVVGGIVYVATNGAIRRFDPATSAVTTFAGSATAAGCVNAVNPQDVRFPDAYFDMAAGNGYLYTTGCGIRKTSLSTGETTTVTATAFDHITVGPDGMLYATKSAYTHVLSPKVHRVDPATGATTVFATLPSQGATYQIGLAIAADSGALWVVEEAKPTGGDRRFVVRVGVPDATVTTVASGSPVPTSGNATYAHDFGTHSLVSAGSYLYSGFAPRGSTAAPQTIVRRINKSDGSITESAGTTSAGWVDGTGMEAWFAGVTGLASDGASIWIADSANRRLRRAVPGTPLPMAQHPSASSTLNLDPGDVSTFAGDGTDATADGTGTSASFASMGNAAAGAGSVFVATSGAVRRIAVSDSAVTTLAGTTGTERGCTNAANPAAVQFPNAPFDVVSDGTFVYSAGGGCGVRRTSIATGATSTVTATPFDHVTFGPDGNLYATRTSTTTVGSIVSRVHPVTGVESSFATLPLDGYTTLKAFALTSDASALWVVAEGSKLVSCMTSTRRWIVRGRSPMPRHRS